MTRTPAAEGHSVEDTDNEADIQLAPSRPTQEEVGPAQGEQEQGPEQEVEVPGEENQQQAAAGSSRQQRQG